MPGRIEDQLDRDFTSRQAIWAWYNAHLALVQRPRRGAGPGRAGGVREHPIQDTERVFVNGFRPCTVPRPQRLLRDTVIPPPRRDQAHRLHWPAWRREEPLGPRLHPQAHGRSSRAGGAAVRGAARRGFARRLPVHSG